MAIADSVILKMELDADLVESIREIVREELDRPANYRRLQRAGNRPWN